MKHFHYIFSFCLHLSLIFGIWFGTQTPEPNKELVEIITLTQIQSDTKNEKPKNTTHKIKKLNTITKKHSQRLPAEITSQDHFHNHSSSSQQLKNLSTTQSSENSAKAKSQTIGQTDLSTTLKGRAPQNITESYLATLRDRIASQQMYPHQSRIFKEEGVVNLKLTVQKDGSLVKIEIIQPSHYKRLNDAALRAITRAAPFSKFPPEISYDNWVITLPVKFTLSRYQGQKSG